MSNTLTKTKSGSAFKLDISKYSQYINQKTSSDSIFVPNKENNTIDKLGDFEDSLAEWTGYYRKFPHKFVEDYLGLRLKEFQKLILYDMFNSNYYMFLASRGLGKTFLTAIFVVTMCILYPETKVVVAGGVKSQAMKIITEKIPEMSNRSTTGVLDIGVGKEIRIVRTNMNTDEPNVEFYNGSTIKVVPATDNARSARANILILDEFRMIDQKIYQGVLRRFLAVSRQPRYLDLPEYAHMKERNKEIFLTSAYYKFHWCYDKYRSFYKNMTGRKNSGYKVVALPYQVAIMSGLVNGEQLLDEMREDGLDVNLWGMEMLTLFYGESDNSYYKYDKLSECRLIYHPYYPKSIERELVEDLKDFRVPMKKSNELRVLSCDIALMSGAKNDNTILSLIIAYPNRDNQYYIREVRYMEAISGGKQMGYHALRIRQLFNEFDCDYIVLDTNGIGMQVFGDLSRDIKDPDTDMIYYGLGCINDEKMHELVPNPDSEKLIYSVKASAEFNKTMNSDLQSKIIRKQIRFLTDEQQGDDIISHSKNYPTWITVEIPKYNKILNPYKQTTSLVNEMINLELVDVEKIKLKEKSGKRKDRFSSVGYGNYFITEKEQELFKHRNRDWSSYRRASKSNGYKRKLVNY